jgi:hypothetical protein
MAEINLAAKRPLAVGTFDRCRGDKPCAHCAAGQPAAAESLNPRDLSAGVWELDEPDRIALPPAFHRPEWIDTCTPKGWFCACCWGDGWVTSWPCDVATSHGVYLARSWQSDGGGAR